MSAGTFTIPGQLDHGAPTAERVRVASQRRYVVLVYRWDGRRDRWQIEYRTDDVTRARSHSSGRTGRVILDTLTGETVR